MSMKRPYHPIPDERALLGALMRVLLIMAPPIVTVAFGIYGYAMRVCPTAPAQWFCRDLLFPQP
jgi:hypothetical protein